MEDFDNMFDLHNPNIDDLGDLLRAAIQKKAEHPNRDVTITLGTLNARTTLLWRGYLDNLHKVITKANTCTSLGTSIETAHYYKGGDLGEGPGQWMDDVYLRIFNRG
jgi:hypothetical protein